MSQTITQSRLRIDANFKRFVDEEVLPGTGLDAAAFWRNFDEIVHDLAPENRQLLAERDRIQAALDEWHRSNPFFKQKTAYEIDTPASRGLGDVYKRQCVNWATWCRNRSA